MQAVAAHVLKVRTAMLIVVPPYQQVYVLSDVADSTNQDTAIAALPISEMLALLASVSETIEPIKRMM